MNGQGRVTYTRRSERQDLALILTRSLDGAAMTKDEILKKHKQYLFPSISTYYSDPLVTDRASMQHLWDVDGNKYLDFFGGIVSISVGHANPRVTSKIKAQVDRLQHASAVFPNEAV